MTDSAAQRRNDYAACSGCSLCLLVCPVWHATRDPRMSPEGRAKALQAGAQAAELAESARACTLCTACEPVCPERIDLIGMTLDLRRCLAGASGLVASRQPAQDDVPPAVPSTHAAKAVVLCSPALKARPAALARALALTGAVACEDGGDDILSALEAGAEIAPARLARFLAPLRAARSVLVDDGGWVRHLRAWLPAARVTGLGEALSARPSVRRGLTTADLYVIEARAYHSDYERLVLHYDRLRAERGCVFNLDLQRIAIPARARGLPGAPGQQPASGAAQAARILKGRSVQRIVVECAEEAAAFEAAGAPPVVHLAELADH